MEHTQIPAGEVHSPYQWVVADEIARLAIVAEGSFDLNKLCLQQDTGQAWRMSATSPVAWSAAADAPGAVEAHEEADNPHPQYLAASQKGANNGVATLDSGGKLPAAQLPALAVTEYLGDVANEAAMLALEGQKGDWTVRTDLGTVWIIIGADPSDVEDWKELGYPTAPVTSVAGRAGAVTLEAADVAGVVGDADSRLTDAREWTAETVSESEAAAGTATTRRAWTAQRVRQAAAAWWANVALVANNTFGGTQTFTRIRETVAAVTGTTPALGAGDATIFTWALSGASTPTSGLADGESCTVLITPTTHSISWTNFNIGDAGAPPLANGKVTTVTLSRVGSTSFVDFVRQH